MKKLILLIVGLALGVAVYAGEREDFIVNPKLSANNYRAYPYLTEQPPMLTPAPQGYEPFYINHYGRHGSRWLINPDHYDYQIEALEKGEKAGKLTDTGKQLLDVLRKVRKASQNRLGELSDIGAEQHQAIARRMYQNFPEVFRGNAKIDAKSTIVIRCILSMLNETDMLKSLNPKLEITADASEYDMSFMNYRDTIVKPLRASAKPLLKKFYDEHVKPERLMSTLFTDKKFTKKNNIDEQDFMTQLFDVVGNMQSHHEFENVDLYHLFTNDEIYNIWLFNNAYWYIISGETPLTHCRVDYAQSELLKNFIMTTDEALERGENCATMRFGHESILLPLVCLIGLNGMDYHTTDLNDVAEHWQCYKVFPMAGNMQWIFYRKKGNNDILVKFLLNEEEAKLPIATDLAPYYHWSDVRDYLMRKLAAKPNITTNDIHEIKP